MPDSNQLLTSEAIQMLVSSLTDQGHARLTEIEAERFLNAISRAQLGVPTGVPAREPNREDGERR